MKQTQLNAYLRQLSKILVHQYSIGKKELLFKLLYLEQALKVSKTGRLSFLLKDCTCPTKPNLISPNSVICSNCPIHRELS